MFGTLDAPSLDALNRQLVVDVSRFRAVGNGSQVDNTALSNALSAAPAGSILWFPKTSSYYKLTSAFAINKSIRIMSNGAEIRQVTDNTNLFTITASDVSIEGLKLVGNQNSAQKANDLMVNAYGASAAAPISNITLKDCEVSTASIALYWTHVQNFSIEKCHIHDVFYGGVVLRSCISGEVIRNYIHDVIKDDDGAGYGITLNREELNNLTDAPRCRDITVSNNRLDNTDQGNGTPGTHRVDGIDTHAAENCTISDNTVLNFGNGIAIDGSDNASQVSTWAPRNIAIEGNAVEWTNTAGEAGAGIQVTGAGAVTGTPVELASGISVTGNTVRGYGYDDDNDSAGIRTYWTQGLALANNSVIECSPHGINLYHDNYGYSCTGNAVVDPWTDTQSYAAAIVHRSDYNTGYVGGNSLSRGSKSATLVLTQGLRLSQTGSGANNAVQVGVNYNVASTTLVDQESIAATRLRATKHGFFSQSAIAKPSAYTQTYSTADKTLGAYTADDESAAYTGAADSEAKLADLNALRVAVENLRAFTEDLAQHHNAVLDDLQALGLLG